ncbi:MAG: dicarboxylate/amino acid:cation symporter, partial [Sphingomonas sp.]
MAKRLTYWILAGLVLGAFVGLSFNGWIDDGSPAAAARLETIAGYFGIITTLFLRLIKMIIAPLVFSTLVVGIAHMGDTGALGRIGLRSLLWFIGASLVSLLLGMLLVNLLQPGVGLALAVPAASTASGVAHGPFDFGNFVSHIVPASMIAAMAENEILQIVVFSVFVGVAITAVGEPAQPLVRATEALVQVMLRITGYVMNVAPVAVFAAVAATLAERGAGILGDLAFFMGSFYLGLALLWLCLFIAARVIVGPRAVELFRYVRDPLVLAFST